MPVVPATQEAEAGELLEPRKQKLQWAKITSLHFSLGNKVRPCLQQQQQKQQQQKLNKNLGHHMEGTRVPALLFGELPTNQE